MPVSADARLGEGARILHPDLVNLYGCSIGSATRIGTLVEIQRGVEIDEWCKMSSHTFICEGVTIEDKVFVGHGVMFIKDRFPRATTDEGAVQEAGEWRLEPTRIGRRASIGSHATVVCGVTIGQGALVGAGAVVTTDVPTDAGVIGVPGRVVGGARMRRGG